MLFRKSELEERKEPFYKIVNDESLDGHILFVEVIERMFYKILETERTKSTFWR